MYQIVPCERMFAVKLLPYMPTREELIFEIERSRGRLGLKQAKKDADRVKKSPDKKGMLK